MSQPDPSQDTELEASDEARTVWGSVDEFSVSIRDIGGITNEHRTLQSGIVPLVGENATNRTSFLKALMAGVGTNRTDQVSVNTETIDGGDSEGNGVVEIKLRDESFTQHIRQTGDGETVFYGESVVTDEKERELLDLYAYLIEGNEVREAVERGGDLYDVLMRPVDIEELEEERNELREEQSRIETELEEIEDLKDERTAVENEIEEEEAAKAEVEEEISDLENEHQAVKDMRQDIREEFQESKEETEERIEELETKEEELESEIGKKEAELERKENDLTRRKNRLRDERDKLLAVIDEVDERGVDTSSVSIRDVETLVESGDTDKIQAAINEVVAAIRSVRDNSTVLTEKQEKIDEIDERYEELREKKSDVEDLRDLVEDVIDKKSSVKDRLAPIVAGDKAKGESRIEGPIEFVGGSESGESDPTNKLLEDPTQCLACGDEPGEEQFEAVKQQYEKIDSRIRDRMSDLNDEQDRLKEEITEIKTGAEELEALERDVEEHGENLIGIVEGIEKVKRESIEVSSAIEGAREELREVQEELDSIVVGESNASSDEQVEYEARLEEVEAEKKELEEKLESKRAKHSAIDRDLEELRERKEELEASIEEKDEAGKKDRLERIEARYDELRGVVDDKENNLIEWFNGTMEKVVAELAFENISRVWIEKRETQVRDGRRKVDQTVFDLQVIRDGENGVYECKREHLSESERNVIGLVLAITGYLVHDVADTCPVVLLDSIEMMDADRVAKFLDVIANVIPNRWTIAALLPDHVTESTEIVADDMEEFTSPAAVSFD